MVCLSKRPCWDEQFFHKRLLKNFFYGFLGSFKVFFRVVFYKKSNEHNWFVKLSHLIFWECTFIPWMLIFIFNFKLKPFFKTSRGFRNEISQTHFSNTIYFFVEAAIRQIVLKNLKYTNSVFWKHCVFYTHYLSIMILGTFCLLHFLLFILKVIDI